jgi:heptosyltransferase-2
MSRASEDSVLVVGPSWVGDMVMAQSLFRLLKSRQPDRAIDVLAPAWSLPIVERMPEVRQGIALDTAHGEVGLGTRLDAARGLGRYDRAIVLPRSLKAALVPFFAGIPVRTGYRGEMRYWLVNDMRPFDRRVLDQTVKRFVALGLDFGEPLPKALPDPVLTVSADRQAVLAAELGLDTSRPVVTLMPGAEYGPAKCWPLEYFSELAAGLDASGYAVWVLGSARDEPAGAAIAAGSAAINLCGRTALADAIDPAGNWRASRQQRLRADAHCGGGRHACTRHLRFVVAGFHATADEFEDDLQPRPGMQPLLRARVPADASALPARYCADNGPRGHSRRSGVYACLKASILATTSSTVIRFIASGCRTRWPPGQFVDAFAEKALRCVGISVHGPFAMAVRTGALGVGGGIQAEHGCADRRGHVRGPRVRTDDEAGACEDGHEFLEAAFTDEIAHAWHRGKCRRVFLLQRGAAARDDNPELAVTRQVVDDGLEALERPVAVIAKALRADRAHDDRVAVGVLPGEGPGGFGEGNVPADRQALRARVVRETHHCVERVFPVGGGDAFIADEPLEVLCPGTIETDLAVCRELRIEPVGAHRRVHAQQYVEATLADGIEDRAVGATTLPLVENDKLDSRNVAEQARLGPADNPREFRVGPVVLQIAHDSERMAGIADRGQANEAHCVRH